MRATPATIQCKFCGADTLSYGTKPRRFCSSKCTQAARHEHLFDAMIAAIGRPEGATRSEINALVGRVDGGAGWLIHSLRHWLAVAGSGEVIVSVKNRYHIASNYDEAAAWAHALGDQRLRELVGAADYARQARRRYLPGTINHDTWAAIEQMLVSATATWKLASHIHDDAA